MYRRQTCLHVTNCNTWISCNYAGFPCGINLSLSFSSQNFGLFDMFVLISDFWTFHLWPRSVRSKITLPVTFSRAHRWTFDENSACTTCVKDVLIKFLDNGVENTGVKNMTYSEYSFRDMKMYYMPILKLAFFFPWLNLYYLLHDRRRTALSWSEAHVLSFLPFCVVAPSVCQMSLQFAWWALILDFTSEGVRSKITDQ